MTDKDAASPAPPATDHAMPRRGGWVLWLPFALVVAMGALFLWGLGQGDNRLVQSHWIGKPVPAFTLPAAHADRPGLSSQELATGQPRLLNIFASWCIPCRVEAPQLEALAARGVIIDGIAIRDRPDDLARFLAETGNPFRAIGADERSAVQIALGSSGVPETFVVDGNGIIRDQIQGVITPEMVPELVARMEAMQR